MYEKLIDEEDKEQGSLLAGKHEDKYMNAQSAMRSRSM